MCRTKTRAERTFGDKSQSNGAQTRTDPTRYIFYERANATQQRLVRNNLLTFRKKRLTKRV